MEGLDETAKTMKRTKKTKIIDFHGAIDEILWGNRGNANEGMEGPLQNDENAQTTKIEKAF